MTTPDDIDALYGLPLDEFTKGRNDLARALRTDGRRDEAAEVAALRKPSLSAWVVNQLARERRTDVAGLLKAAAAIRSGDADADERFRGSVDGLLRSARELLDAAGRRPSDSVLQEVATTLRASAAAEPEELAAGRLTEAREASGFDVFAGAAPRSRPTPAKPKPKATPAEPKVDRAAVEAARRALTEARGEARELRKRVAAADREARRAQDALAAAEARVDEAERGLESLRRGLSP